MSEEPAPRALGYFILQQRPDSEYDNLTGRVFEWRDGSAGSKQIQEGVRFIYYRPGEQVFFGSGLVERIAYRRDGDGHTLCDGEISEYRQWTPPLPLTPALAQRLSFVRPEWLGVGQAGIRKISFEDYEILHRAYRQMFIRADDADQAS